MFGYVKPYIPNLTVADYEYYRAAYCGLCRSMGKICGRNSRFTLSYDGVFLALLRIALIGEEPAVERHACPYAPLARRNMLTKSSSLDYSAGAGGVLAALKFEDDAADEHGFKRLGARMALIPAKKWIKRADERDEGIAARLRSGFEKYYITEDKNSKNQACEAGVEESAEVFGEIIGELASRGLEGENYAIAYSVGRHVGRWIYCVDALDDIAEDAKKGRYNPFLAAYGKAELSKDQKLTLECLLLDECESAAFMLNLAEASEDTRPYRIIKNILEDSMPRVTRAVLDGSYRKPARDEITKKQDYYLKIEKEESAE